METKKHAVIVVGGGPTGLMLAAELKLGGVDALIIERRADHDFRGSRARGIHARTIELLDQRGIADRFIAAGQQHPGVGFAGIRLDISDFPTRHNYLLGIVQSTFEPILADWVRELGVQTMHSCEVVDFTQDDKGVSVTLSDGQSLQAEYVVGCDGGRSLIRKIADIDFPGLNPTINYIIAEGVKLSEEPKFGVRPEGGGIGKEPAGDTVGVVVAERAERTNDPDLEDLRQALIAAYGTDYGLVSANWISHFSDATRQAATYRKGRILLAGDAAHIHPPQGGQGMGVGLQDAVNLGWKLAQVLRKVSSDCLLDSYHDERHPIGLRVLQNTRAQVALSNPDDQHAALRETMGELLSMDEPRKHIAGMLTGLDIHYDLGSDHPLVGRRMPDLDIRIEDNPARIFNLLHDAHGVLLNLGKPTDFDMSPWRDRVRLVNGTYSDQWELPVIGQIDAPTAVLIRPDGYVAWTGGTTDPTLPEALKTWF